MVERCTRFETISTHPARSSSSASVVSISERDIELSLNAHVRDAHSSLGTAESGDRFVSSFCARDN
jgi:hypothetical protein